MDGPAGLEGVAGLAGSAGFEGPEGLAGVTGFDGSEGLAGVGGAGLAPPPVPAELASDCSDGAGFGGVGVGGVGVGGPGLKGVGAGFDPPPPIKSLGRLTLNLTS